MYVRYIYEVTTGSMYKSNFTGKLWCARYLCMCVYESVSWCVCGVFMYVCVRACVCVFVCVHARMLVCESVCLYGVCVVCYAFVCEINTEG